MHQSVIMTIHKVWADTHIYEGVYSAAKVKHHMKWSHPVGLHLCSCVYTFKEKYTSFEDIDAKIFSMFKNTLQIKTSMFFHLQVY